MAEVWSTEFLLFLGVGIVIVVYEAHKKFNQRSGLKSDDEEDNKELLSSLDLSEIRNRYAFASAELVYLFVIVLVYLLITFSESVNTVVTYIFGYVGGGGMKLEAGLPVLEVETKLPPQLIPQNPIHRR